MDVSKVIRLVPALHKAAHECQVHVIAQHKPRLFKIAAHRQIAVICLLQLYFWHEALLVQLPMATPLRPGSPAALCPFSKPTLH